MPSPKPRFSVADHDQASDSGLKFPQKITLQVVAAIDAPSQTVQVFVVEHRRPDLKRFVRSQVIRSFQQEFLPNCLGN